MTFKFDIDKLQAIANNSTDQLTRSLANIAKLLTDTVILGETKADLKKYEAEIARLDKSLDQTIRTSNRAESLTNNMIEFIHKYEPVFIQRQISQAIQNIFPDPNV